MSDINTQMDSIKLTYDKRRKGHKFSYDGMEMFFKGSDTEKEREKIEKQINDLLAKEEKQPETSSFAEGGLEDEGGTVDPVSGNEVPPGSTQKEVRDDIPAQLSEGEFVFPADVVRYIGLENLMKLRQKAKAGLKKMEDMGQMGNSEEAVIEDDVDFEAETSEMIESLPLASGGMVRNPFATGLKKKTLYAAPGAFVPPQPQQPPSSFSEFVLNPAKQLGQSLQATVTTETYIGPNGERVPVQFVNGRPITNPPAGYRKATAQELASPVTPEIKQPEVTPVNARDEGPEDEERAAKKKEQYDNYVDTMDKLAAVDPDSKFAKEWSNSPHKEGSKAKAASKFFGTFGIGTAMEEAGYLQGADDFIEEKLQEYNLDPKEYENDFYFGPKYDQQKAQEAITQASQEGLVNPRGKEITDQVRAELEKQKQEESTVEDTSASKAGGEDDEAIGSFSKGGEVKRRNKKG